MKTPSSGFLDIDLKPIIKFKRLNKDGKWEKMTRKRRPELQAVLELMRKECGDPCLAYDSNCLLCKTWIGFEAVDKMFEE